MVNHGMVGEESDDLYRSSVLRAKQPVNLTDPPDHLGPVFGGEARQLLLDQAKGDGNVLRLRDHAPVSVGLEPAVADHDLAPFGNVGGHPVHKFQIVHLLK